MIKVIDKMVISLVSQLFIILLLLLAKYLDKICQVLTVLK